MKVNDGLLYPGTEKKRKSRNYFLIGALLGAAVFLLLYGPSTLNVTYDSWIYCGYIEEDVIQRYAGWMYYRHSPWSWPLTVAENVSVPYGASIAFTDSIPVAAILCKIFAPVLPATFQYFGWYNLLNFVLMGGFSMLLLAHFKLGRLYSALGSLLFLFWPVFIERSFRHDALASQWIIIAALLLYFRSQRQQAFPIVGFWLLCVLTPAIHTYFVPMVYVLLVAALLQKLFKTKRFVRYSLYLAVCFAGTVLCAYVIGLLTRGGGGGASGFGKYSMNLNALYNPSSFDWYAQDTQLYWSWMLPVFPRQYHQYDGFNYLGAGVLLGLAGMAVSALVSFVRNVAAKQYLLGKKVLAFVKRHGWLLAGCFALTLFSLSNVVVFNTTVLFTIPLAEYIYKFCAIFRASGRMFWVCSYLLGLSLIVWLARKLPGKKAFVALALILAVQLGDMSGLLMEKHRWFTSGPLVKQDDYTSEGWKFLDENYDSFFCLGNIFEYNLAAGIIRYNPKVTTNMIITNRGKFPAIMALHEEVTEELLSGQRLEDGVVYLCSDREFFEQMLAQIHPDARGYELGRFFAFANPIEGCPLEEHLPDSSLEK